MAFAPINLLEDKKKVVKDADDLSSRLKVLKAEENPSVCNHAKTLHLKPLATKQSWITTDCIADITISGLEIEGSEILEALKQVAPLSRQRQQKSYTSLTHTPGANARDVDKAQESEEVLEINVPQSENLPRGKQLGIAWHAILENLLREPSLDILEPRQELVESELRRNGVFLQARRKNLDDAKIIEETMRSCISALSKKLEWKEEKQLKSVCLKDLSARDRKSVV